MGQPLGKSQGRPRLDEFYVAKNPMDARVEPEAGAAASGGLAGACRVSASAVF